MATLGCRRDIGYGDKAALSILGVSVAELQQIKQPCLSFLIYKTAAVIPLIRVDVKIKRENICQYRHTVGSFPPLLKSIYLLVCYSSDVFNRERHVCSSPEAR